MNPRHRYFIREFKPGMWHVCDRTRYGKPLCGEDGKRIEFSDQDSAIQCMEELNWEAGRQGAAERVPICGTIMRRESFLMRPETLDEQMDQAIRRDHD